MRSNQTFTFNYKLILAKTKEDSFIVRVVIDNTKRKIIVNEKKDLDNINMLVAEDDEVSYIFLGTF